MFNKHSINTALLPMKLHYFLFNAGTGPVVPFLSTYAKQLGFSSSVVGVIYTVIPICGMLAKPLVGAVTDYFHCQKRVFILMMLITATAFVALNYTPHIDVDMKIKFLCDESEAFLNTCISNSSSVDACAKETIGTHSDEVLCELTCPMTSNHWNTVCNNWHVTEHCSSTADTLTFTAHLNLDQTLQTNGCLHFKVTNTTINGSQHYPNCPTEESAIMTVCDMKCNYYVLNELISTPVVSDSEVYGVYQYWVFLLLMIGAWVGQAVIVSVGDAICFELLDDKPHRYGQQRLFGALGWGLLSIVTGFIIDAASSGEASKNYIYAFYLGAFFMVLDAVVSWTLQYKQSKRSPSILRDVARVVTEPRIFIHLIMCICVGLCTALVWNFLFWHIEDLAAAMGCDSFRWIKTLEGLVMGVQCLGGELPFFFLSGSILNRIGHVNAITLIMAVLGVRFILYSVITNPWWFLPLEATNGLTFGLFYACMASYASIVAPPGTEATVQGMFGAVFEGVGVSLGSFIAGYFFEIFGGPITFRIFGVGSLIMFLVHHFVQYVLAQRSAKKGIIVGYASPEKARVFSYQDQQEMHLVAS